MLPLWAEEKHIAAAANRIYAAECGDPREARGGGLQV